MWDGVTNPVALRNLRAMKAGERAFVYHTGDGDDVFHAAFTRDEIQKLSRDTPLATYPRLRSAFQ